jgi:hypothetical protein
MEVRKISCSQQLEPIECINPRRQYWAFRWNHHDEGEKGWYAYEAVADHQPSIEEIKDVINAQIDAETQNNIVNNFYWNDKNVVLTDTAQRNFLFAVYHLDHTGEIDRAPFVGLLEADTDATAADELGDMVAAMWTHIKECRSKGQAAKAAVDYSVYEL